MWINWNPNTLLVEMENGAVTLENNLAVPQKVKQSHHVAQKFKRIENTYTHKNEFLHFGGHFISTALVSNRS